MADHAEKCLLILLDGLADRSHAQLNGLTPLQAARTPCLDGLAAAGLCGHHHALALGQALPSEAAHYFMLGYAPEEFPGRGYLEALGEGVDFEPGDVLLLSHLARCRPHGSELLLTEKKPRIDNELAEALFQAVAGFKCAQGAARLVRCRGSSGILVLSGDELSPLISDSDPMLPGRPLLRPLPWQEAANDPRAQRTAQLLGSYLAWAHQRLAAHELNRAQDEPINAVITQRAGQQKSVPGLKERWGLRTLSISSAPIYSGVFRALGAQAVLAPEHVDPGQDLAAKMQTALERLEEFDFFHVHTKAPDEAAHAKDPQAKRAVIESLDAGLAQVLPRLPLERLLLVITGDHATASSGDMIHSGEASPLLLHGPGLWRDACRGFDEVACAQGALGTLRGTELMHTVLNAMDRGCLWGLRDTPARLPFYPGPGVALQFK